MGHALADDWLGMDQDIHAIGSQAKSESLYPTYSTSGYTSTARLMKLARISHRGYIELEFSDSINFFECYSNSIPLIDLQNNWRFIGSQIQDKGHLSIYNLIKEKIGRHAEERFRIFESYSKGWEGGGGEALNSKSVEMFFIFLKSYSFSKIDPAIFMSSEGNLILNWHNIDGSIIEIEFYPDRIGYYSETDEDEGEAILDANGKLDMKFTQKFNLQ